MGAYQQKECCAPATDVNDVVGSEAALMLIDELIAERALQPLTDAEIGIVENTWKQVAGLGVETVGVILFKHIFTIAPDALGLFAFRKEPNVKTYETPGLRAHGVRVVTTVGAAVDGLRNLPALVPVLQELAIKHVGYGVLPEHYEVVGKALMLTLKDGLGAAFTERVQVPWAKVWHTISKTMIDAQAPVLCEKKAEEAEAEEAAAEARAKAKAASKEEEGPISRVDIHLVQESWSKVEAMGEEAVGVALFRNIFTAAPEALGLFPFKDGLKNLYESPKLKAHASKVIATVSVAVNGLTNLKALVPVLQELGLKHVGYKVLKPHYDVVGSALITTLSESLEAAFTEDTKAAWLKVWELVSTTMIGNHYS
mmetsp:Transcript_15583/g.43465  ORF Transcript_15583/g.43465 Transcript_15583/m.43465 type:complete len:369 (+) Transcript_15583:94-1200(+)